MSAHDTPPAVQETVEAVTQCVLRVDERSIRVLKAEGRDDAVRGSVLHWHDEAGRPVLAPPELVDRVAASLRAVRRARKLSQHDLGGPGRRDREADVAGRAGRARTVAGDAGAAERGPGRDDRRPRARRGPRSYRIGRRTDDPERGLDHTLTLLGGADSDLLIDLVHLDARESGRWRGVRGPGSSPWRAGSCRSGSRADARDPARRGAGRGQRADRGRAQPRAVRGGAVLGRGVRPLSRPLLTPRTFVGDNWSAHRSISASGAHAGPGKLPALSAWKRLRAGPPIPRILPA